MVHVSVELSKFFLLSYPLLLSLSFSVSHSPPYRPFFKCLPSNRAQTRLLSSPATHYPPPLITVTTFLSSDTAKYFCCWLYSTLSDCHIFIAVKQHGGPFLNRAAYLSAYVRCFIIMFHWVPALSFCNERKRLLPFCLSPCAWCHTQWWSIIEWFCEGSMRLGIVFIPLSLWISSPFISALRNSTYSTPS